MTATPTSTPATHRIVPNPAQANTFHVLNAAGAIIVDGETLTVCERFVADAGVMTSSNIRRRIEQPAALTVQPADGFAPCVLVAYRYGPNTSETVGIVTGVQRLAASTVTLTVRKIVNGTHPGQVVRAETVGPIKKHFPSQERADLFLCLGADRVHGGTVFQRDADSARHDRHPSNSMEEIQREGRE